MLVTACAEGESCGRHGPDLLSHGVSEASLRPADMFVPMIQAFGKSGDLKSAVECYDEYKALAISNDNGLVDGGPERQRCLRCSWSRRTLSVVAYRGRPEVPLQDRERTLRRIARRHFRPGYRQSEGLLAGMVEERFFPGSFCARLRTPQLARPPYRHGGHLHQGC